MIRFDFIWTRMPSVQRLFVRCARQIDVLTVNEAGQTGLHDSDQLEFAAATGRTIFTFNRGHYIKLHKMYLEQGKSHAGIIVSDQHEIGIVIRRLLRMIDGRSADSMKNSLEFLSNWQ